MLRSSADLTAAAGLPHTVGRMTTTTLPEVAAATGAPTDVRVAVTVYSTPSCPGCAATYRLMDKLALPYASIDMSQDDDARTHAKSLGHLQAPVVVVSDWVELDEDADRHWSGFRDGNIKALAARVADMRVLASA